MPESDVLWLSSAPCIQQYGPQLQAAPASISSRAHFNKVGFGARDEKVGGNQFWTLRTMMKHAGVDWIDILKVRLLLLHSVCILYRA